MQKNLSFTQTAQRPLEKTFSRLNRFEFILIYYGVLKKTECLSLHVCIYGLIKDHTFYFRLYLESTLVFAFLYTTPLNLNLPSVFRLGFLPLTWITLVEFQRGQ